MNISFFSLFYLADVALLTSLSRDTMLFKIARFSYGKGEEWDRI